MSTNQQDPPGLDLEQLRVWAGGHLEFEPASASLITGGKSNLTYELHAAQGSWILRRPPLGHVLATAHDMGREYRVMSALADTRVPVPRTLALCEDESVIGAPFYVMERVEGRPYRWASELEALGAERTRAIAERMIDTLVELHRVDPHAVGLSEFGRPAGFLARQVERWRKQMAASHSRDLPLAEELHGRLAANVPQDSAPAIVHGDYRLDNLLVGADDEIGAVVDWEMATLGDPLTDLALMVMYDRLAKLMANNLVSDSASAPGFPTEAQLIDRYRAASPRDMSQFGFYLGLAAYKLASILEGIHYRFLQGQTVGEGFEGLGDAIDTLLQAGLEAM
ncbi:MAG: phosphotransferase family protein [Solirubrobacterales bacterium]|nr:phosphotransferase family protein [Solirubrobacterales bacterium]